MKLQSLYNELKSIDSNIEYEIDADGEESIFGYTETGWYSIQFNEDQTITGDHEHSLYQNWMCDSSDYVSTIEEILLHEQQN